MQHVAAVQAPGRRARASAAASRQASPARGAAPQAALAVAATDHPLERMAERTADRVMRLPAGSAGCACGGGCSRCSGSPRPAARTAEPGAAAAPPVVGEVLRSPGEPLAEATRDFFESRFGTDLSHVRLHTDARARRAADAVAARAWTVGSHVAFAAGEYDPTSRRGLHVLAHEIAHVLQQPATSRLHRIPRAPTDVPFVGRIKPWSVALRATPDKSAKNLADLPRGHLVTVKGGAGWIEVETEFGGAKLAGYISHELIERSDLREGTQVPDADQQQRIGAELDPSAFAPPPPPPPVAKGAAPPPPPPPVRAQWDGLSSNPDHVKNRAKLEKDLLAGLKTFLSTEKPRVAAQKALARIPMKRVGTGKLVGKDTGVQGIADAANGVLEARYGAEMNAAVRTPTQEAVRQAPMNADPASPGQNLFDAYSKAARKAALGGVSDQHLAFGVAWWAIQHDANSKPHLDAHNLSPGWFPKPATEEWTFTESVLNTFVATGSNEADLIDYRLFIWNETTDEGISLLTTFDPATQGGDAAKAERVERWDIFGTAIHETVHFRAHPVWDVADKGRGTMLEGFTEMFAKDAADPALAEARAGSNEALRLSVEGAVAPLDASVIPKSKPVSSEYQEDWKHAKQVRTIVGESAARAAFFQGHVELLGLDPKGADLAGLRAKGAKATISKPPGIGSLADLATATGLSEAEIKAANPGITDALLPQMVLPGCREHVVVGTSDAGGAKAVESRAQIARQHGIAESDLVRANPGIPTVGAAKTWGTLTVGQKLLVPRH